MSTTAAQIPVASTCTFESASVGEREGAWADMKELCGNEVSVLRPRILIYGAPSSMWRFV